MHRHKARELALQLLYQMDIAGESYMKDTGEKTLAGVEPATAEYAETLVDTYLRHKDEIDETIATHSHNWQLNRMAYIDRNVLRMGTTELLFMKDVPPKVAIDEAVEMAKTYGGKESPAFVNGILDAIYHATIKESENESTYTEEE